MREHIVRELSERRERQHRERTERENTKRERRHYTVCIDDDASREPVCLSESVLT